MPKHARVCTEDEFNTLLLYVAGMRYNARNKLIVYLSHKAGMRVGEIASLKHSDVLIPTVDVCMTDNGRAVFENTVQIQNIQYVITNQIQLRKRDCKQKHARTVHLSSKVQSEFKLYYGDVHLQHEHIFINRLGNPLSNVALAQEIRRWYMDCGLQGCSSHTGRRGYVTGLLERQINVKVVQELVGHKHLSTTQCYAETMDSMLKDAVEAL